MVENLQQLATYLDIKEDIKPLLSFNGKNSNYLREIPLEFHGTKVKTQIIFDTLDILGFHLELGEVSSKTDFDFSQTKYVTGSDHLIGDASTMLHFELVTKNATNTFEFLNRIFGSQKVEEFFSGMLDSDFMHIIHVNLNNVVLQYCQPIVKEGTWYDLLSKNGSYVHNLNFCVDDIEKTVKKYQNEGFEYIFQQKLTPDDENFFYMLRTLHSLGFHMEHGQAPKGEIPKGFFWGFTAKGSEY